MIYDHESYREFLKTTLAAEADHGARSRLARAASCSPSWITRVLAGQVQLTPDQALAAAQHLGLGDRETDYFLLLVDKERAATLSLKRRIERRLADLKAESSQLSSSLRTDFSLSESHRVCYYSSWVYPTVHVACMIRGLTLDELMQLASLGREAVTDALRKLEGIGLVKKAGPRWEATTKNIHLPSGHALTNVMHANWRQKTTQVLQERGGGEGLHYSGVHCLSLRDVAEIKARLTDVLLDVRKRIETSPSEALAIFCMDWFTP
jgi:uncharacterized protein (TIGR02147 family)